MLLVSFKIDCFNGHLFFFYRGRRVRAWIKQKESKETQNKRCRRIQVEETATQKSQEDAWWIRLRRRLSRRSHLLRNVVCSYVTSRVYCCCRRHKMTTTARADCRSTRELLSQTPTTKSRARRRRGARRTANARRHVPMRKLWVHMRSG